MTLPMALACLALSTVAWSGEQRSASVWWNGVEAFAKAQVSNSMSAAVRRPGTAGKVSMPAVFLHPEGQGRATARFPQVSSGLSEGMRAFLLTHIGIADGFDWADKEHSPDGARFYAMLGGQDVLSGELKASRWVPLAAQLYQAPVGGGEFAGDLALATDCGTGGNASYDWAMFGDPLVVATSGLAIAPDEAVLGAGGVIIVDVQGGAGDLIVEGLDAAGNPVPDASATQAVEQPGLTFVSFDFGAVAGCSQWRWSATGCQVREAWGGSWEPRMSVVHAGAARGVNLAGEPLLVRAAVRNDGKGTLLAEHGAYVECNGLRKPVERLAPGETAAVEFDLGVLDAGYHLVKAEATSGSGASIYGRDVPIWPTLPALPAGRPKKAQWRELNANYLLLENPHCRWVLYVGGEGQGALFYTWAGGRWELSGSVQPWLQTARIAGGAAEPRFEDWRPTKDGDGPAVTASFGTERLAGTLELRLADDSPALQVSVTVEAQQDTELLALWGPAVHAGDRSTGRQKGIAIFPGLEYLEGDELSSSTRDLARPMADRWTPHRFKVTMPLMMVETRDGGPVVAVAWDPNQKWDGEHGQPATRFSSPDQLTQQDSHLLQLGLPSVPEFIPESADRATVPVQLQAGDTWRLEQQIVAAVPTPDATGLLETFDRMVGYPEAEAAPRSFEEEMALCRRGFLESVWDEATQTSLHYVGSGKSNAPGFATLMLMDARAVARGDDQARVMERVKLIADKTLREGGAPGLTSSAACHIMGWEFPYHWGHLPAALPGMRAAAYGSLDSQEADGGWGYYPDESRRTLGEPGTRVIGIAARNAYLLAKWLAISGDPAAESALREALAHMEQYRVPRGAQGWECPILEPDVLASAYAVRAYVWTYMATGEAKWLDDARFWARTGLPFQYTWDDGQRPGMRYASIPVFGSTFFSHSWLGLPVQWCGLVYAYGLQELLRFDDNPLWRKQVDGMTVSAMHQQWPEDGPAELVGTYPDSYGQWFTHRNPVHINPEDIQVNVLALHGLDPGLRSVPVKTAQGLVHVTAPGDVRARAEQGALRVDLTYLPAKTAYLTLAPVALTPTAEITASGRPLTRQETLAPGQTGWALHPELNVLVIGLWTDPDGAASVTLKGVTYTLPKAPQLKTGWEFEADAEGWVEGNSCAVSGQDGALKITATGADPYAISGPSDLNANRSRSLTARVRLSAGTAVGLFWRSTVSPGWGPDKEAKVDVPADGAWHEVTFDLSQHALWSGKVTQIRLDLEPADVPAGTTLEVDWVRPVGTGAG